MEMQETGNGMPDRFSPRTGGKAFAAVGRGMTRLLGGLGHVWQEAAARVNAVSSPTAAFVLMSGGLLMLIGLVLALLLRERPLLTVAVCLGSILVGAVLIGFSKIVEAAELYIHRGR